MSLIVRFFARNLGRTVSAKKVEEPVSVKVSENLATVEWMANRHVHIESMPKALISAAKSIFSSHNSAEVREWGYKLAQYYTEIHGLEKPRDITKLQPFISSIETLEKKLEGPHRRGFYKLPKELKPEHLIGEIQPVSISKNIELTLRYQPEHAIGYTYKRMPNTYASVYRIIHEIKHRMPEFEPKTCLDYGAGTGAGSWAVTSVYPLVESFAIEPSKEMRTIGKKLSKKMPNIHWAESVANLPSISEPQGLFDIVICGYVLGEIENAVTRNLILDALWQRTRKVLVFVEPGTPKGFRLIYSIREWVLKTMNREEANVIAPCPHDGECPLASHPKSWCHFSQFTAKYPPDVIPRVKGENNYENEKFSYIAVSRGIVPRYLPKSNDLDLAQQSFLWPRLVRPTLRRTKHVTFDVCRVNKLERITLSKGKTKSQVYKFIRKAHWGDLWPFTETLKTEEERLRINGFEKKVYEVTKKITGKDKLKKMAEMMKEKLRNNEGDRRGKKRAAMFNQNTNEEKNDENGNNIKV